MLSRKILGAATEIFLNQACASHASHKLMHTWFLKIAFIWELGMHVCMCVCVWCVCVCLPLRLRSEMKPKQPIKQVLLLYSFYIW